MNPALELALLRQLRGRCDSMRDHQKAFFASKHRSDLHKSKELEREVDGILRRIGTIERNPNLFFDENDRVFSKEAKPGSIRELVETMSDADRQTVQADFRELAENLEGASDAER